MAQYWQLDKDISIQHSNVKKRSANVVSGLASSNQKERQALFSRSSLSLLKFKKSDETNLAFEGFYCTYFLKYIVFWMNARTDRLNALNFWIKEFST